MKCYYEVLGVESTADDDVIKKAYRRLALEWHPDKNPDRVEESRERFTLIQQAYEVLIDPHERAWYDRHKDSILKGGFDEHYEDNSLNLFSYFNTNCYKGFQDDEKGFYSVYRQVFEVLAAEDYDFLDDDKKPYPGFGFADSDYDKVVGPFYAFWQSFSTARSFAWLDKYDIRNAPNRLVLREMEKENKKVREAARKTRSEEIRELVRYVRKRDKRVQQYKIVLEKRRIEQEKKVEEKRREMIRNHQSRIGVHKETEEVRQSHLENLRVIEEALDAEFGAQPEKSDLEEDEDNDFFCIFCDKVFKTKKAQINHEKSKKHKDTVNLVRKHMKEDDYDLFGNDEMQKQGNVDEIDKELRTKAQRRKKKKKREQIKDENEAEYTLRRDAGTSQNNEDNDEKEKSKIDDASATNEQNIFLQAAKNFEDTRLQYKNAQSVEKAEKDVNRPKVGICERCGEVFESRTKLFAHLNESGHATVKIVENTTKKKKK